MRASPESITGHRDRCLRNVGREHDPLTRPALENLALLLPGQTREQRQHLDLKQLTLEQIRNVADLALSRQENEHVAAADGSRRGRDIEIRAEHGYGQVRVVRILGRGSVAHLDRMTAAAHGENGRSVEEPGHALDGQRRGGDDNLEVGPVRQEPLDDPEEQIHVERALVRLVHDQRVVAAQVRIRIELRKQ
jgi:hypothetical protein